LASLSLHDKPAASSSGQKIDSLNVQVVLCPL